MGFRPIRRKLVARSQVNGIVTRGICDSDGIEVWKRNPTPAHRLPANLNQ